VGYGDITLVAHAARSLAILAALIGQLYPAIVLARLASLHVASGGSGWTRLDAAMFFKALMRRALEVQFLAGTRYPESLVDD
jgi:hypothetical protein